MITVTETGKKRLGRQLAHKLNPVVRVLLGFG
jgi:hypothetical protein